MATKDNNLIRVGKVSSTHGVKGFVKLYSYQQKPENIKSFKHIFYEEGGQALKKSLNFTYKFSKSNFAIVSIEGINSPEEAQALMGKDVFAPQEDLPKTSDEEFYPHHLKGLTLVDGEAEIGEVIEVHNFGAGDILEVKLASGETSMLPFNKETIGEIDLENSKIFLVY